MKTSSIALACICIVTTASAESFRNFTSADGQTVNARVINYEKSSDEVKLEKAGGGIFSVPVSPFSDNDQVIIRNWDSVKGFLSETGIEVSCTRDELRRQERDLQSENVHVIHQWLKYTVKLKNNTGRTFNNIRVESCPFYSLTNSDRHDPDTIVRSDTRGAGIETFTIESISPGKTIELATKELVEEICSGGINVNGRDCSQKSVVIGIWIRLFLQLPDGKSVMREFKEPSSLGDGFSPGDSLSFPDTTASLSANKNRSDEQEEQAAKPDELPRTFKLRDLPQVVQEGAYCVPASGEVIAKFHGIETDQWEIAKLSSQNSMDNSGTNPNDMASALENFGIHSYTVPYKHAPDDVDEFIKKTLPLFKKALVHDGPMYISIREIFGGNHGCVVIGYSDKREKMYFYNPWGEEFNLSYKEVAKYTYRAIAFAPPILLEESITDFTSLIETLKEVLPDNAQSVSELRKSLKNSGLSVECVECNRRDAMHDTSMTERLASREGQKLIDLALERVPAILIPQTGDAGVTDYVFIRKSPESKEKLLVQRIDSRGWEAPELSESRLLTRYWTTPVGVEGKKEWLLPLFELSGTK